MGYVALDSADTVQVLSPSLVYDANLVTIRSDGGWILLRTIPKTDLVAQTADELLTSLADGVDSLVGAGYAVAAWGVQDVDASNLLYDAVRFTVAYDTPGGGQLTTEVDVRVEFVAFTATGGPGASAENLARDQLQAAYDNLRAMAGG